MCPGGRWFGDKTRPGRIGEETPHSSAKITLHVAGARKDELAQGVGGVELLVGDRDNNVSHLFGGVIRTGPEDGEADGCRSFAARYLSRGTPPLLATAGLRW